MSELWVVGDVHGALATLRTLLQRAGLTDPQHRWAGGTSTLVMLGDLTDRGPDGAGVVRLVQELERGAAAAGGELVCLLGNHEVMLQAAARFGRGRPRGDRYGLHDYWRQNGGQPRDLQALSSSDLEWLAVRPLLHRSGGWLFSHADALLYLSLGDSLQKVQQRAELLLRSASPENWVEFLNAFAQRETYLGAGGPERARRMLQTFGGERLAHGHTPVFMLRGEQPSPMARPYSYAGGLALGLDSAMAYQPGAGFMVRLEPDPGSPDPSREGDGMLETVLLQDVPAAQPGVPR